MTKKAKVEKVVSPPELRDASLANLERIVELAVEAQELTPDSTSKNRIADLILQAEASRNFVKDFRR